MDIKQIVKFSMSNNTDIETAYSICSMLFKLGFTNNSFNEIEKLDRYDKNYYATALLYKCPKDSQQNIESTMASPYVIRCVDELSCVKTDNPFWYTEYLEHISNSFDVVAVIKAIEFINKTYVIMNAGFDKSAKEYFHKADVLWNKIYHLKGVRYGTDKPMCNLWEEIAKLNIVLEKCNEL